MAGTEKKHYEVRFRGWFRCKVHVVADFIDERDKFIVFGNYGTGVEEGALILTDMFAIDEVSAINMLTPLYGDARNIVGATHA